MMIEFGDHGEEEQRLLLRYLESTKPQSRPASAEPKAGRLGRLFGRFYLAYLRWHYRVKPQ